MQKYQDWQSKNSGSQSKLHKAIGNRIEAHRTGQEKSNVSVGNINVNKIQDAHVMSESINEIGSNTIDTGKEIARDAAENLETTGDYITYFGVVTGQPEIIGAGELISGIGTGINITLDLTEGKSFGNIVIENGSQMVFGKLSDKAMEQLTKDGSGGDVINSVIKGVEISLSEITDHLIKEIQKKYSSDDSSTGSETTVED
ncbi:hypothetical protein [Winogradskyella sp.]|uniref:hypothetical protein n=1 Tax=Winogradskyella sp. TaxID=1883156 RepID=UPI003BAD1D2E